MKRRNVVQYLIGCGIAMALGLHYKARKLMQTPQPRYLLPNYLRPPGAIAELEFKKKCNYCNLCGEACPRGSILFIQKPDNFGTVPHTPYIQAEKLACDLCLKCTKVCPTGALKPLQKMEDVTMGKAVIDRKRCLPYANAGGCGACYSICPLNAVHLHMQRYPEIINDRCTGCGLCVEICLTKAKSIMVRPT